MTDLDLDAIEAGWKNNEPTNNEVALVAALREARAEVLVFRQWRDDLANLVREWMLPQPGEAVEVTIEDAIVDLVAERDDWRRRYEALRDGVTGLCDEWDEGRETAIAYDGMDRPPIVSIPAVRAVVARVEGDDRAD